MPINDDPRDRPWDPAGTKPRHDPTELVPQGVAPDGEVVEGEVVEEDEASRELEQAIGDAADRADGAEPRAGELVVGHSGGGLEAPIPRETEHTPRFQFLLGALLALGAVAIAAAVALGIGGGDGGSSGPSWSPWKPTGKDKAASIAGHVGPEYRLPNGLQLVQVTGGPLEVADLPIRVVMTDSGGDYKLLGGTGALYRMCGLGPDCAIPTGKPTTQRGLLLRREALELALYTFRYQSSIDQVVVFLPPRLGCQPNQALLFKRSAVGSQLSQPLQATLSRRTPSVTGITTAPDTALVDRLTSPAAFQFNLTQQNQDASVLLVLGAATTVKGSTCPGGADATTSSSSTTTSSSSGSATTTTP